MESLIMAEAFLDAGLLLCDLTYTLLEMVRSHYFPPTAPGVVLKAVKVRPLAGNSERSSSHLNDLLAEYTSPESDEFESLQVLLIGSANGVNDTIRNLHARGFAEVGDWSPLLPAPNRNEVMSILSRQRRK
jgi:hypothetical protein